jgi:hypothetical protein
MISHWSNTEVKDRQLDEDGEMLKTEHFSIALITSCPPGSALRAAAAEGALILARRRAKFAASTWT